MAQWFLDFNATVHVVSERNLLSNYEGVPGIRLVQCIDGRRLENPGSGSADDGIILGVNNVQHVQGARKNIISAERLEYDGMYATRATNGSCRIMRTLDGALVGRGQQTPNDNDMYLLEGLNIELDLMDVD